MGPTQQAGKATPNMGTCLVALHGALGSAQDLLPLQAAMEGVDMRFFDFPNHGKSAVNTDNQTLASLSQSVMDFINEEVSAEQVVLFGHSMGGYVAVNVGLLGCPKLSKIVTLGTKYHWDIDTATREAGRMNPDIMEEKIPAYCHQLSVLHGPNRWKDLVHKTASFLIELGTNNPLRPEVVQYLTTPVKVIVGELDTIAGTESSQEMAHSMPQGTFITLPQSAHFFHQTDLEALSAEIRTFL